MTVEGTGGSAGAVHAAAAGRAQQAVIGQGVQNNYFYGASGQARPGVVLNTLLPPPSVLVGHARRLPELAAACEAAVGMTGGGTRTDSGARAENGTDPGGAGDGAGPGGPGAVGGPGGGADPGRARGRRGPAVVLLHGPGGSGKSALARALAERLADGFTDARLEVDLFGFTPGSAPREPGEVLAELLWLAGFSGSDIPAGTPTKAQLWRAWLSDKNVLLLLDNARDAEQVKPLLPGPSSGGRSLVLVTGRYRLDRLETAVRAGLDQLDPEASVELLLRVADRPVAEASGPRAAELAELARLCGHLPLALRPVGALLAEMEPRALLAVMRSAAYPLEQLDDVDQDAAAAFQVSYDALSADLQRVLRTCVWHPGPDFDAASIAALAGMPAELATVKLVRLLQRSMLTSLPQHRYVFHDLFLAYARRLVGGQDPDEVVAHARHGLYRHLDDVVGTAHGLVYAATDPTAGTGPFDNPDHARMWTNAASEELAGAASAALAESWETGGSLAVRTARLLYVEGRDERAEALYAEILAAAERAGDAAGQGLARIGLGDIARGRLRHEEAVAQFEQAAGLLAGAGDRAGRSDALRGLGEVARARGEHEEAIAHFEAALRLARAADNPAAQGYALTGLGHVARALGDFALAGARFGEAVELQRRADDGIGLAYALRGLGHVARADGDLDAAVTRFQEAILLHQRSGNRFGQAFALTALGGIAREQERYEEAATYLEDALALHRAVNNPTGEAQAHEALAALATARGDEASADAHAATAAAVRRTLTAPVPSDRRPPASSNPARRNP
ncbi:tetratricopeptide repeat protein [Streptomyces bikiniensis]|uniref:Tetratricopeptide repeat protein n=1 Tax=Streptomyces bikiniensis TaxID=1896 RepID=A0ABW8CXC7_STRBI